MDFEKKTITPKEKERLKILAPTIAEHLQNAEIIEAARLANELEEIGHFSGWLVAARTFYIAGKYEERIQRESIKLGGSGIDSLEESIMYFKKAKRLTGKIREVILEYDVEIDKEDDEVLNMIEKESTEAIYAYVKGKILELEEYLQDSMESEWVDLQILLSYILSYRDSADLYNRCGQHAKKKEEEKAERKRREQILKAEKEKQDRISMEAHQREKAAEERRIEQQRQIIAKKRAIWIIVFIIALAIISVGLVLYTFIYRGQKDSSFYTTHNKNATNEVMATGLPKSTMITNSHERILSSPFSQKYWIVFTEGTRNDRIEASTFDTTTSEEDIFIIWDRSLVANIQADSNLYDQFRYLSNDKWEKIGSYYRLSDFASSVIASNVDVYDSQGNIIIGKTPYDEIEWDTVKS